MKDSGWRKGRREERRKAVGRKGRGVCEREEGRKEGRGQEERGGRREEEIVPAGIMRKTTRGMLAQSVNAQMRKAK